MIELLLACVALCYAAVILLEWLCVRGCHVRGYYQMGVLAGGLLLHTVWLAYRVVTFFEQSYPGGTPFSVRQDWYYGIAWGLSLVCLIWMAVRPKTPFGLFFLPWALILIGAGYLWGDPLPLARRAASQVWGTIHGASLLLAVLSVCIAFLAGLMYLGQAYRLKARPVRGWKLVLPSLEWSRKANTHALGLALAMLGVGILSGAFLNAIESQDLEERLPWSDPVVVATTLLFVWLGASLSVGLVYRPLREGRRVVFLTAVSFIFMLVVFVLVAMGLTQHGRQRGSGALPGRPTISVPQTRKIPPGPGERHLSGAVTDPDHSP